MIDVVTVGAGGGSIAWLSPEGTLKVGPHSAGADPGPLCYAQGRHPADHHRRPRHPRPDPSPPARRRDPARRRGGPRGHRRRSPSSSASTSSACATGILEISAWNQANALRQVTVKRGLDVRDFTLTTFGGSGSLLACRLVDILDLAGVARTPQPGQRQRLRPADRRRQERLRPDPRRQAVGARPRGSRSRSSTPSPTGPARRSTRRASPPTSTASQRTTDLRYFGQAFEVRVAAPEGDVDAAYVEQVADDLPRRAPPALRLRLPRRPRPAGRVGQPPRHRHRPDHPPGDPDRSTRPRATCASAPSAAARGLLRRRAGLRRHAGRLARATSAPGDTFTGPGHRRGVRLHHPRPPRLRGPGRRLGQPRDPQGVGR